MKSFFQINKGTYEEMWLQEKKRFVPSKSKHRTDYKIWDTVAKHTIYILIFANIRENSRKGNGSPK